MSHVQWTEQEDKTLRDMTTEGFTQSQIAAELEGRTTGAVGCRVKALGLSNPRAPGVKQARSKPAPKAEVAPEPAPADVQEVLRCALHFARLLSVKRACIDACVPVPEEVAAALKVIPNGAAIKSEWTRDGWETALPAVFGELRAVRVVRR